MIKMLAKIADICLKNDIGVAKTTAITKQLSSADS